MFIYDAPFIGDSDPGIYQTDLSVKRIQCCILVLLHLAARYQACGSTFGYLGAQMHPSLLFHWRRWEHLKVRGGDMLLRQAQPVNICVYLDQSK